jgi:hypothetical protein
MANWRLANKRNKELKKDARVESLQTPVKVHGRTVASGLGPYGAEFTEITMLTSLSMWQYKFCGGQIGPDCLSFYLVMTNQWVGLELN